VIESERMFLLAKPADDQIHCFLAAQRDEPFSYAEVGMTQSREPARYNIDHHRIRLGSGGAVFAKACDALRQWTMFDLGWVKLFDANTPIETGATVCVRIQHFGFWSLNACRIVYVVDENVPVKRYGFAYGTLAGHGERGEERFTIEWQRADDSVWYDILACSRPRHLLAKLGYPLTRALQKRFARDSQQAMWRAVNADK
jgi:uncharacterized protein (UPF0548 family)